MTLFISSSHKEPAKVGIPLEETRWRKGKSHHNYWTPEQDQTCRLMVNEGRSYAEIGKIIGRTRCGVAGYCDRNNISVTDLQIKKPIRGRDFKTLKVKTQFKFKIDTTPIILSAHESKHSKPLHLTKNNLKECRWPLHSNRQSVPLCCGDKVSYGPYCQDHARIAYKEFRG